MARDKAGKCTPNQMKYLWSFEIRFGQTGKPGDWFNLNKKGEITFGQASELIGWCKDWEKTREDSLKAKIENRITIWSSNFKFKDHVPGNNGDKKPSPDTVPNEVIKVALNGDMTLDEMLEALAPVLEPGSAEVIQELYEQLKVQWADWKPQETSDDYIKPEIFDDVFKWLKLGENVLIYGPAGCGKSRMGRELAKALELERFVISGTGGKRYAAVFGGDQLKVDENGKQYSEWTPAPLIREMQEPRLIQLEEVFGFDPDTNIGFNGLLETNDRSIETPMGMVEVNPETVFVATANINGRTQENRKYTGTKKADDSLNDRFIAFHMDYDLEVEDQLLEQCAKESDAKWLKEKVKLLRAEVKAANISFDVSTRRMIRAIKGLNAGIDRETVLETCFLNHMSTAERNKIGM